MIRASTELRNRLISAAPFTLLMKNSVMRIYSGDMPAHPEDAATGTRIGYITTDGGPYLPAVNGLQWYGDTIGAAINSAPWVAYFQESGVAGWVRLSTSFASGLDDFDDALAVRVDISADAMGLLTTIPNLPGSSRPVIDLRIGLAEHI